MSTGHASSEDDLTDLREKLAAALADKDALTAALAHRNTEFGERIEQQSATIDVLKAMSASPGDLQPVFDLIARRAAALCESRVVLTQYVDDLLYLRVSHGFPPDLEHAWAATFPRPPSLDTMTGRAVLERRIIHVGDGTADHALMDRASLLGGNTAIVIPILREGAVLGTIGLNSDTAGRYTDSQIALL